MKQGTNLLSQSNIQCIGRWENHQAGSLHSYWGGAYFQLRFSGTTIKLNLGQPTSFIVFIDEQPMNTFHDVKGLVNLTPTPLDIGIHTLRVAARYQDDELVLEDIIVDKEDEDEEFEPLTNPKELIEFIGDSITAGDSTSHGALSAYAWISGERLNMDHTSIAYSGITLVDGYRHPSEDAPQDGMSEQYFKTRQPNHDPNPDWDFNAYSPRMLVINLGTNDHFLKVPSSRFQQTYISFLEKLRKVHPHADIVVLRTFGGFLIKETKESVEECIQAGDQKLHYIDTVRWLSKDDYVDGVHPSDEGNQRAANQLTPLLAEILSK